MFRLKLRGWIAALGADITGIRFIIALDLFFPGYEGVPDFTARLALSLMFLRHFLYFPLYFRRDCFYLYFVSIRYAACISNVRRF